MAKLILSEEVMTLPHLTFSGLKPEGAVQWRHKKCQLLPVMEARATSISPQSYQLAKSPPIQTMRDMLVEAVEASMMQLWMLPDGIVDHKLLTTIFRILPLRVYES